MSYQRDLDEITEKELLCELANREWRRSAGMCDYCNRPPSAPPCKFPSRHSDPRIRDPKLYANTKGGAS